MEVVFYGVALHSLVCSGVVIALNPTIHYPQGPQRPQRPRAQSPEPPEPPPSERLAERQGPFSPSLQAQVPYVEFEACAVRCSTSHPALKYST
ncbi:hypothetical protein EDC01DRAFT_303436 [Geopyxis carbonaria]|nr:hypothetical protein EDC01DRAFT_303436 [Geopyxis carbonaria]